MTEPAAPRLNGRPDTVPFPRVAAHRGASRVAPENTLTAFREAARLGARALEFDVSLLGDDTLVMHHDATLERCTDGSGPLAALGRGDLAGIDAGRWFSDAFRGEPLATLEQGLDLIEALGLVANLEMKPHDDGPERMAGAVARALAARSWTRDRILVSSFGIEALEALRAAMPEQPLAVLYDRAPEDWPTVLARLGASSLHIWYECADAALLDGVRAEGVHLRLYTVNDPARVAHCGDALAGVITDHPPLFLDHPDWRDWAKS